jgi:hypothetical protein
MALVSEAVSVSEAVWFSILVLKSIRLAVLQISAQIALPQGAGIAVPL